MKAKNTHQNLLEDGIHLIIKAFNEQKNEYENIIDNLNQKITDYETQISSLKEQNKIFKNKIIKLLKRLKDISTTVNEIGLTDDENIDNGNLNIEGINNNHIRLNTIDNSNSSYIVTSNIKNNLLGKNTFNSLSFQKLKNEINRNKIENFLAKSSNIRKVPTYKKIKNNSGFIHSSNNPNNNTKKTCSQYNLNLNINNNNNDKNKYRSYKSPEIPRRERRNINPLENCCITNFNTEEGKNCFNNTNYNDNLYSNKENNNLNICNTFINDKKCNSFRRKQHYNNDNKSSYNKKINEHIQGGSGEGFFVSKENEQNETEKEGSCEDIYNCFLERCKKEVCYEDYQKIKKILKNYDIKNNIDAQNKVKKKLKENYNLIECFNSIMN